MSVTSSKQSPNHSIAVRLLLKLLKFSFDGFDCVLADFGWGCSSDVRSSLEIGPPAKWAFGWVWPHVAKQETHYVVVQFRSLQPKYLLEPRQADANLFRRLLAFLRRDLFLFLSRLLGRLGSFLLLRQRPKLR